MAVATDTIIQKMMKELTQAQQNNANSTVMKKHIANVQLLCELILEDEASTTIPNNNDITKEEMKAMIGDSNTNRQQSTSHHEAVDDDEANGNSIFDF